MLGEMVCSTVPMPAFPFRKSRQDIVTVGADDQLVDGQTTGLGGICGKDIAKISGGHRKETDRSGPSSETAAWK